MRKAAVRAYLCLTIYSSLLSWAISVSMISKIKDA
jgi:hypothetical protein